MWSFGTTMTMASEADRPRPSGSSQPSKHSDPSQVSQPPQALQTSQNLQTPEPFRDGDAPRQKTPVFSQRSLQQLGIFFAGAGFLALSTLITRRSINRKWVAMAPKFYQPSNHPVNKIGSDSSLIALEALNLATLNVMGFGIMATGGLAWAFDVSNIQDLRNLARRHVGPPGGKTDEEAEREVEEWVAKVLLRKEQKDEEADALAKRDR